MPTPSDEEASIVLVDALNVAYWRGAPPTLQLPISLWMALRQSGQPCLLCFDASTRYRIANEFTLYQQLLALDQEVVEVPSGQSADRWLLRRATQTGGRIISRDRFGDHRSRHRRLIDDPTRCFGGFVADQQMHIPALDLIAPLLEEAECFGILQATSRRF